jgi:hypothetical protein
METEKDKVEHEIGIIEANEGVNLKEIEGLEKILEREKT